MSVNGDISTENTPRRASDCVVPIEYKPALNEFTPVKLPEGTRLQIVKDM